MTLDIVTAPQLDSLKQEFLSEMEKLRLAVLSVNSGRPKKWLKGEEVMEMLSISKSTLQNLRESRKIRYTKLTSGMIRYDANQIDEFLKSNIVEVV